MRRCQVGDLKLVVERSGHALLRILTISKCRSAKGYMSQETTPSTVEFGTMQMTSPCPYCGEPQTMRRDKRGYLGQWEFDLTIPHTTVDCIKWLGLKIQVLEARTEEDKNRLKLQIATDWAERWKWSFTDTPSSV